VQYPLRAIRTFWRWAIPFWMFRDVSCGTIEQRSANYRFNRSQRDILYTYTLRWMAIAAVMMLSLQVHSDILMRLIEGTPAYYCATVACVSSGIGFSFACVVIALLMAAHFFLTYIKQ
jgi:hypothetical protein